METQNQEDGLNTILNVGADFPEESIEVLYGWAFVAWKHGGVDERHNAIDDAKIVKSIRSCKLNWIR